MKLLEWVSYKSANHLIALSPGIMEGIVKRNIPPSKITLIPNGSDLEFYLDTSKGWKPAGINDDDLVAVFAGTHGYANGLMSIIETALELKRRNETRIKFILIGDGANKRNLMEIAKRNKLENIIFHPPVNKGNYLNYLPLRILECKYWPTTRPFILEPRRTSFSTI